MKNLRKILLVLIVIILSGCSVKYQLVINNDSSVNEKVIASDNKTKLKNNTGMNEEQAVQYLYKMFDRDGLETHLTTTKDNNNIIATVTGYHNSIDEYTNNFMSDIFVTSGIKRKGDEVTLLFNQIREINPDDINRLVYDDIEISIALPFKVIEHNADEKNGNTYIWKIRKNKELREIKLVYNEKKVNNKFTFKFLDTTFNIKYEFIVLGIFALAILIIVVIVYLNNKKNNKV